MNMYTRINTSTYVTGIKNWLDKQREGRTNISRKHASTQARKHGTCSTLAAMAFSSGVAVFCLHDDKSKWIQVDTHKTMRRPNLIT